MIDLHHHCLPGVDDGPRTLRDAVAQLAAAAGDGIRTVVATPHRRHPQYDVPADAARRVHGELEAALRESGVDVRLLLGHEVHYSDRLTEGLADGDLLTLGGNGRWFLFELPASHVPAYLDRLVFDLQLAGRFPLLAHPERNAELAADPPRLEALRLQGVRMQVTAMSVTGEFGQRARKASEAWLRKGWVDVLATDAHDLGRRPAHLRAAVNRAAELVGEEAARRLVEGNPECILAGGDLP